MQGGFCIRIDGWRRQQYPLKTYLLRPYAAHNITQEEIYFNYRLSRTRRCIACAFGIATSKWRCLSLKTELQLTAEHVGIFFIKVICLLHNICINFRDTDDTVFNIYANSSQYNSNTRANSSERHDRCNIHPSLLVPCLCSIECDFIGRPVNILYGIWQITSDVRNLISSDAASDFICQTKCVVFCRNNLNLIFHNRYIIKIIQIIAILYEKAFDSTCDKIACDGAQTRALMRDCMICKLCRTCLKTCL